MACHWDFNTTEGERYCKSTVNDERRDYSTLKAKHNDFALQCQKGGKGKAAKKMQLEANSLLYLEKKKNELEDENKSLKKELHDLQTFKPVNPSKEMRAKNAKLERELFELMKEKEQLEYEHNELHNSETHRELAELKDKLKEDKEGSMTLTMKN